MAHYKDDLHEEMGKVYLDYGKSLLGCFRQHCQPLGDAVPKNSLEESDEDEDAATEGTKLGQKTFYFIIWDI